MAVLLTNLSRTLLLSAALTLLLVLLYAVWPGFAGAAFWPFFFRWLHVLSALMWVGLLYYFNFVQVIAMPAIPDEQKPAISKHIAPRALFWFRWAAVATVLSGLILAHLNGYMVETLSLGLASPGGAFTLFGHTLLGIGMWLGLIMALNVWLVIWPCQKKALGLVPADAATRQKAARRALLFSRANTALSLPMLFGMVGAQNLS